MILLYVTYKQYLSINRVKSLEPFSRHFIGQKFLDMLEVNQQKGRAIITGTRFLCIKIIDYFVYYIVIINCNMYL